MRPNRIITLTAALVAFTFIAASCAPDDELIVGAGENTQCQVDTDGHIADAAHDVADTTHDDDTDDHDGDHDGETAHDDDDHDGDALMAEDVELTIEIDMVEFAYGCTLPVIPAGTVVALAFTNRGEVDHEAVVGDQDAQDDAEIAMATMAMGDEGHGHATPSITVKPGETAELIVQFDEAEQFIVGCHIPGHWDLGMHTDLTVTHA